MEFDLLVTGGVIVDGSGAPAYAADVGVRAERIEAIGHLAATRAKQVIDATGRVVSPGFIDAHTHSDLACFLGGAHQDLVAANVRQGVTTEVCGNCGFSVFPVPVSRRTLVERNVGALLGEAPLVWQDVSGYGEAVERSGLFSNLASLVGLGSIRAAVVGFENRVPDAKELRSMQELAEQALEQGAWGISSGLIYAPGMFASTSEIVVASKALRRFRRPYVTHIRGESYHVVDSVKEAIRIGEEIGVPVHISHHKAAGKANWGRTHETLEVIQRAKKSGIDVTVDVYPYTSGSTVLQALVPPWAQVGGTWAMVERLGNAEVRRKIGEELGSLTTNWENLSHLAGWERIRIATCPGHPDLEGRPISDLASDSGKDELDFVLDLLVEQRGKVTITLDFLSESDVRNVLSFPGAMIGSDGIPLPGKPHPRWSGSFARILGVYSRHERLVSLANAVRQMTGLTADRFSLAGRGYIKVGAFADLTVFDPSTIIDRATFSDPLLAPDGVDHVIVNGQLVVLNAGLTGSKPGRMLRAA